MFGANEINVPVRSVMQLLVLEVLNPFYIFQVASIIIWCLIEYYTYSAAIALMSAAGIVITIVQTRQVIRSLNEQKHNLTRWGDHRTRRS